MRSRNRWHSFTAAARGAVYTIRTQRNTWIELAAAAVVVAAGIWLRIEPLAWAILALTIAAILALEAVNSAIEAVVDLASPDYHELARTAKDCAAGAMIFAVLGSLGVAVAIFGPPLVRLLWPAT
jgi:diacylglycerol kinase (ATP)